MRSNPVLGLFFAVFVLLTCSACNDEEILSGISERESIEIVTVLNRAGISSNRIKTSVGKKHQYKISVAEHSSIRALEVLHELGYPRKNDLSFEELTRQKGFVPNSSELNQLRTDRAYALEAERLLRALPGVVDARAVIRTHSLKDSKSQPRASIVIRFVNERDVSPVSQEQVLEVVQNAVSGLEKEQVSVSFTRASLPSSLRGSESLVPIKPFNFQVPESQKSDAVKQLLLCIVAVSALAGIAGIVFGWVFVGKRNYTGNTFAIEAEQEAEKVYLEQRSGTKTSLTTVLPPGDKKK